MTPSMVRVPIDKIEEGGHAEKREDSLAVEEALEIRVGGKSISVLAHYSLTLLPEKPMVGRYFDPRVGYFTQMFEDYAADKNWMVKRQYIARFRLEKKDHEEEISEPVKPIVFSVANSGMRSRIARDIA